MFLYFLLFFIFFCFAITAVSLAPFFPTYKKDLERINRLCDLKAWDNFVEIWSWTGRVSRYIALNNREVNIIWIELNIILFLYSKIKGLIFWPTNFNIKFWNAFKYDYSKIDVVYIFWIPKTVSNKLSNKLYEKLPKSWKYISYVFKVENWSWKIISDRAGDKDNKIYICTK